MNAIKPHDLRLGNYLGYKVREDGVIFSNRDENKQMTYRLNDKGYPTVMLNEKGKSYCKRVHRILLL